MVWTQLYSVIPGLGTAQALNDNLHRSNSTILSNFQNSI